MQWLFLTIVTVHVVTLTFAQVEYLQCTLETEFNPGVCDCTGISNCLIKFTITKNIQDDPDQLDQSQLFSVNGGRIAPTIIVDYNQIIVVDVFNDIDDTEDPDNANISIHWHGMHQWNIAWMDGVGMVTQWPTKPHDAFRYVFRAHPAGTHWYHSHVRFQRDEGIVGALIVRDAPWSENAENLLKDVIDEPAERMLAIRDHVEETTSSLKSSICEPDRSLFPFHASFFRFETELKAFRINGVKLSTEITDSEAGPTFSVQPGQKYRFRIVGIMSVNVLRFSIAKHKLQVISADGYLTQPFETDILIIHIGERYDFILETNEDYDAGTVFPIRIETVAVTCEDILEPGRVSYAYLQYTDSETPGQPNLVDDGGIRRCIIEKCTALNCPFEKYHPAFNTTCHDVEELQLLDPTPENELPMSDYPVIERFFNFGFQPGPSINGIDNTLPQNIPFVHSGNEEVENECTYEDTDTCDTTCSHSVHLNKNGETFSPQVVRFVISTLSPRGFLNVAAHPAHLHGHSYFVAKIGYPTYDENGAIIELNKDVTVKPCGHGQWTNGEPSGINVNSRTVRKDIIIVPAGGYVVIEFLADNPGWWYMHCHIDGHSNNGMALAINELPECQNPPEHEKYGVGDTYEESKSNFLEYEMTGDKCGIRQPSTPATTPATISIIGKISIQVRELKKLADLITQNLRQKIFNPVANENHDSEHVSPYYKRLFERVRARGDTEQRKFQDRKRDEYASEWDALNLARDEQI